MTFEDQIKQNRKTLLKKWFRATVDTYPPETARVLGNSNNKFDNPVGVSTRESLEEVLDRLEKDELDEMELEKILDPVIRIRAIQSFSASDAVGFIFMLKDIVEETTGEPADRSFLRKVDRIALAGFNRFMKCREDIYLLKATEAKRRVYSAFERSGLAAELKEEDLLGSDKS
ncbi:MAG: RsbRD N-terminal domain-containing protein [Desulfarculaceae bacterium]|nr:RsbRD N-terminal domain-containing protein [Desulfarculaceae bacterium]